MTDIDETEGNERVRKCPLDGHTVFTAGKTPEHLIARLLSLWKNVRNVYPSNKSVPSTTSIPASADRENRIIKYLVDYHTIYPMSKIPKHLRNNYPPIKRTHTLCSSDKNILLHTGIMNISQQGKPHNVYKNYVSIHNYTICPARKH